MVFCIALGCNNQSQIRTDLSFYKLPLKNEEILTKWLVNLRKPRVPQLLDKCYVCSDHFELDCFGRDLKAELLGGRPKPPLTVDAVPTLFLYNNYKGDNKRRVFSEERKMRKEKEQVLKDLLGPYYDMKLIPPEVVAKEEALNHLAELNETFSIQSLLPIAESSCQTDPCQVTAIKCTTETSCQTVTNKPCLVTTSTQWSERDFEPNPHLIEEEHTYCKKRRASVACQVETLSLPTTRASKTKTVKKTGKRPYRKRRVSVACQVERRPVK